MSSEHIKDILGPRTKEGNNITFLGPRIGVSQQRTNDIAQQLVDKFKAPKHKRLFLRAAWRLTEDTINRYVTIAFDRGRDPLAYFISLVKADDKYYDGEKKG